jgi:hypothetical protein
MIRQKFPFSQEKILIPNLFNLDVLYGVIINMPGIVNFEPLVVSFDDEDVSGSKS